MFGDHGQRVQRRFQQLEVITTEPARDVSVIVDVDLVIAWYDADARRQQLRDAERGAYTRTERLRGHGGCMHNVAAAAVDRTRRRRDRHVLSAAGFHQHQQHDVLAAGLPGRIFR